MNLADRVVLITGARRVGRDLARLLATRGASIALTYHTSRDAIEAAADELRALGVPSAAIPADLSLAPDADRAVSETVSRLGRLDVLVNMASIYRRTPLESLAPSDFDDMVASNLAPAYHTSLAAAKAMKSQPRRGDEPLGKIINVGDWATDRPYKHYLPYLVAKGALSTLTLALARELAPEIAVNLVQPAMIDPPPHFSDADKAAVLAQTPLRRIGAPSDLNRLILYLLEATDFATGSTYRVDGGRFLGVED